MKLNLTDGKSTFSVFFAEDIDRGQCIAIRQSTTPVSTALTYAKRRLGIESGVWPAPGVSLEGLNGNS